MAKIRMTLVVEYESDLADYPEDKQNFEDFDTEADLIASLDHASVVLGELSIEDLLAAGEVVSQKFEAAPEQ